MDEAFRWPMRRYVSRLLTHKMLVSRASGRHYIPGQYVPRMRMDSSMPVPDPRWRLWPGATALASRLASQDSERELDATLEECGQGVVVSVRSVLLKSSFIEAGWRLCKMVAKMRPMHAAQNPLTFGATGISWPRPLNLSESRM